MKKHRLIWNVNVTFPEKLTDAQYDKYIELMTKETAKHDTICCKTFSSTFCTFYRIKQAEKFALYVANAINADMDVISNRQRKKWRRRGVYTGYIVSPKAV